MSVGLISGVGWVLSPTRKVIDLLKRGSTSHAGRVLRAWSLSFFCFDVLLALGLAVLTVVCPGAQNQLGLYCPLVVFAWSRVNEITYAFYRDALSRISKAPPSSDLEPIDRIRMAIRSYFGLLVGFSVLFYFSPIKDGFSTALTSYFDAFYFSGTTLATLGYGDIAPKSPVFRVLALYEVFAGILLVAVSIATYLGAASNHEA